jgi:hypothetical protein
LIAVVPSAAHGALELPERLAKRTADLRQPARAKEQEHNGENDDEFTPANIHISPEFWILDFGFWIFRRAVCRPIENRKSKI